MYYHHDALEYDLQTLGLDLMDLYSGDLTTRKLCVMVDYLPQNCATVSEIRAKRFGGSAYDYRSWTKEVDAITTVIDAVQLSTHSNAQMNTKKKLKAPELMPRPGDDKTKKRSEAKVLTIQDIKRMQRERGN